MSVRRVGAVVAAAGGALLACIGGAWACSAQPSILAMGPPAGPAGSVLALKGQATAAGAPVAIHWNGLQGPVVGRATADGAGNYLTNATLPNAIPGVYAIVAVSQDRPVARLAVEITPSPGSIEPSLAGRLASNAGSSRPGTGRVETSPAALTADRGLAVGAGVLGLGLVAAASGAGVAALRRRRVAVERSR